MPAKREQEKPIDPTSLKKFRFYKNNYKIVKINCVGTSISRKSISLERFNKFFGGKYERLRSSWNAISEKDATALTKLADPRKEIEVIRKRCGVIPAGRFGGFSADRVRSEGDKLINSGAGAHGYRPICSRPVVSGKPN